MPHEKLRPSFAFTTERIEELRRVVPEAFADGKVNWTALRESLGDWTEDEGENAEHFGLTWPGKRDARRMAALPSQGTLVPVPGEGVEQKTTRNIFIEGDNLEVLKLLQKSYAGRVKMIYIDPPYNTGNDFIYEDDFHEPIEVYLRRSGQLGDDDKPLSTNTRADGRFHSKWLSMMYPRLRLSRNLLKEDGVLMVSCNDEEASHLKVILSEIFGAENFVATFVWNNEGNIDNQSKIKVNHEYIHCFARDAECFRRPSVIDPNIEESSKLYNEEIENSITKNGPANPPSRVTLPKGFPASFEKGEVAERDDRWPRIHRAIQVRNHALTTEAEVESGWSSRNLLLLFIENGCVPIQDAEGKETRFAVTESGAIYGYKKRSKEQGHVLTVIRNVGTTKQNSTMLSDWGIKFDFPKPVMLIAYLTRIVTSADDMVLDFFAGSGTTAHAVMRANAADGGKRSSISVQLQEPIANGAFANIAELAKQRIRKAGTDVGGAAGDRARNADTGFKVFRLDRSSFKPWTDYAGDNLNKLMDFFSATESSLRSETTPEGLLVEILLLEGFPLDSQVESLTVGENKFRLVTAPSVPHRLLVCLDTKLLVTTARSIDLIEGDIVVCLDSALSDEAKLQLADRCLLKTM